MARFQRLQTALKEFGQGLGPCASQRKLGDRRDHFTSIRDMLILVNRR